MTDEGFYTWYDEYPRKVGKRKALLKWRQLERGGELPPLSHMLAKLRRQRLTAQWRKEDGKYIPHPSTYLHQGRWDDEIDQRLDWDPAGRPPDMWRSYNAREMLRGADGDPEVEERAREMERARW